MPPSNDRPWSTQYQEDFNKKRTKTPSKSWSNHQKKASAGRKKTWGQVPMATAVSFQTPENIAPYIGEISGLDDEADLDFAVNGHHATLNTRDYIQQATMTDTDAYTCTDDIPKISEAIDHSAPAQKESKKVWNHHWSQWPEPKPPEQQRPHTSIGFHRHRPSHTDNKKHSTSPEPPRHVAEEQQDSQKRGQPMQFVPDFKSWINTINDYEKQEVANMLTTLRRSNTFHNGDIPTPPRAYAPQSPGRDTYTAYHGPRPSYANLNPSGFYGQSFHPHGGHGGPREDMYIQGFAKQMEGREPLPNIYTDRDNRYPLTSRLPNRPTLSDEYVHEHSMFMTTTPRVRGHFIIHPDWVSERSGLRRSLSSLTTLPKQKRQSRNGLTY